MPLYEYRCSECGEDFEQIVRFSEADLIPPCPHCSSTETSKKITAAASFGSGTPGGYVSNATSCGSGGFT